MNRMTRRHFLRAAAASGFAYAFARTPRVTYAQMTGGGSFADYKALVCVFLFGGNDSWNMVVPSSAAEYAEYAGSRQNLAVPQGALLPLQLAVPDAERLVFRIEPGDARAAGSVQRRAGGDRRQRRPARRPDDPRAVPEPFRAAAAAAVLAQRSAGPVAFAQGHRGVQVGLGRPHRRRAGGSGDAARSSR